MGAKEKTDKGPRRERKPFCWDWWRVQTENMAPLLTGVQWSVCVVLLEGRPPYVCAESNSRRFIVVLKHWHCVFFSWDAVVAGPPLIRSCVVGGGNIMDTHGDEAPTLPL